MDIQQEVAYIIATDESGISSTIGHSVYVFVYIKTEDYQNISEYIIKTEQELNIKYIHWSEMPWKFRLKVAERLVKVIMLIKAVSYTNPVEPEICFTQALGQILSKNEKVCKIILDGKKSVRHRKKLKKFLRDGGFGIKNIKTVNDKNEPIIRIADFIAGMLRTYMDTPSVNITFIFEKLKNKILTTK